MSCRLWDPNASEHPFKLSSAEECRIVAPEPVEFPGTEELVALEDCEQDCALEGIEIDLSILGVPGKWMMGVEMETSPKKLERGVGDCSFGMGASHMPVAKI